MATLSILLLEESQVSYDIRLQSFGGPSDEC